MAHQITPEATDTVVVRADQTNLDTIACLQTPPYGVNEIPHASEVSVSALINEIAIMLSIKSEKYSTNTINNSLFAIKPFLTEISKRSKCSKETILLATVYTQKLYKLNLVKEDIPQFALCGKRIFLSCLIIAHKFLNDNTFSMETWCLISGLKGEYITAMERWCLYKLDYQLNIKEQELVALEKCFKSII